MLDSILINSPVGSLYLAATSSGLRQIKFHPTEADLPTGDPNNSHLIQCRNQLEEYFEGQRRQFDLVYDWSDASDFYKQVWTELLKIPYGKTVAYSDIANDLQNPKAVRAVGMANGKNPLPIVVPCHRVIGKTGHLHGFTGGLDIKERLLFIENPQQFSIQKTLF